MYDECKTVQLSSKQKRRHDEENCRIYMFRNNFFPKSYYTFGGYYSYYTSSNVLQLLYYI